MRNSQGDIVFIPGQGKAPHEYPRTLQTLRATGMSVHEVSPPWESTFREVVARVWQQTADAPCDEPILLGHSYGANLALAIAKTRPIGGLILASTSILCANGLAYPQGREIVEEDFPGQQDAIRQYEIGALASELDLHRDQVAVFVGGAEARRFPYIAELAETTAETFGTDVRVVPNAPQFIEYSEPYILGVANAAWEIHAAHQDR